MIWFVLRQEGGWSIFAHFYDYRIIDGDLVVQFLFTGWFDSVEIKFNINLLTLAACCKEFWRCNILGLGYCQRMMDALAGWQSGVSVRSMA